MKRLSLFATVSFVLLAGRTIWFSTVFATAADPSSTEQPKAEAPAAKATESDATKAEPKPIAPAPAPAEPKKVEPPTKPWQILATGTLPADARLGALRKLDDKDHPWEPAPTLADWQAEAGRIRRQLLVSTGLWPMPPKLELNPVIHGKIDRDDYTIEKVYFASHPGHYVTGNLYRPKKIDGKVPGVLCPHGHWKNGRFYDAGDEAAAQEIAAGAEKTNAGAHFPLQARMVQLARMGCVVFHYDMVGNADSKQIAHAAGFTDAEASLRLQNFMGLQTFNSLRALDFLTSLPEVDSTRIGVTGASGGGTQTFMLCALDRRPTVAFPAVMVSENMQGGCICENADYLRLGINNIAIAALFAPKPLAMSGANDWTIDIETQGLPELQTVYSYYDKPENVMAKCFPQFGHNYNCVSRELMYHWFNKHLKLGLPEPVEERDFTPVPPDQLSVFDAEHTLPADAKTSEQLREYLTNVSNEQFHALVPQAADQVRGYRRVVGAAARVMLDSGVPGADEIQVDAVTAEFGDKLTITKGMAGRLIAGEQIPFIRLSPKARTGKAVLWIDARGKKALFDDAEKPTAAVARLLDAGYSVISADVFQTGEFIKPGDSAPAPVVDQRYSGYTFGYNRPLLSNRVRDILTLVGAAVKKEEVGELSLVGTGEAGPWVMLAAALSDRSLKNVVADANGFSFAKLTSSSDAMFLPGSVKYGDVGGLTALAVPTPLTIAGAGKTPSEALQPLKATYEAAKAKLTLRDEPLTENAAVDALLSP